MNSLQKLKLKSSTSHQSGLYNLSKKYLGKTFRATKYNLRLYRSNLYLNSNSFAKWESVSGPDGYEKTQTDRNPDNFKYKTNLFSHSLYEMRHLYGDVIYQIVHRRHRLNDPFMKYVIPTSTLAFYLLSGNHLFFMSGFLCSLISGMARVLSKTEEPRLDEVWLFDFLLNNKEIGKYLKKGTFHVIDFNMEFDKGIDSTLFPEYNNSTAKFFNVDTNTTTGFMKLGDVETGAMVHVDFKTMAYSTNYYAYADPFLIYDMKAEVNLNGNIEILHLIKAEDVLAAKRPFVPLF